MNLVVVTAPEAIVTLDEAKRHLKIDADDDRENGLVQSLVAVATATIDGPGGGLGLSLGQQTLELRAECLRSPIVHLPYPPIISVDEVEVDGVSIDHSYYVPGSGAFSFGMTLGSSSPVRIRYTAGWPSADGAWSGPVEIKHAILMMVARLYHHRGEDISTSLVEDRTVRALLARHWRFAVV